MTATNLTAVTEWTEVGLAPDYVDYRTAWDLQRTVHAQVVAGSRPGACLLLEHSPVYTAGKRTEPHERPTGGTEVIDVDRGGKITWHGPGQLVGYPIVRLPDPFGVVDYVRRVEEALIRVVSGYGIDCGRVEGRSGVWLAADATRGRPERKIAAIGVRVASGVTMHGFALNCDNDLNAFGAIVPCGITDAGVTSLTAELGRTVIAAEPIDAVRRELTEMLQWQPYDRSPDIARASGITLIRPRD